MRFSILIPTWNNLDFLKLCVASIRKNSSEAHEILVFANEGKDGTTAWLKQEGIRFLHADTNVGVCTALNALFDLASENQICYLNDDMYVCAGWDVPLIDEIRLIGHEKYYLSATMIEPRETGNACVLAPYPFGKIPEEFDEAALNATLSQMQKSDWSGATWPPSIMHRTMWQAIGGYGEEFSPGLYSDPDVSMKLWQQGVRIFKGMGKSLVYHFMSKSTGRVKMNNGKTTFLKKWGVSSSWFVKTVLKQGQPYIGPLTSIPIRPTWKDRVKYLLA